MTHLEMDSVVTHTKAYRDVANAKEINGFQPLYTQIELEKNQAQIMCAFLNFGAKQNLAALLMTLDYATYIPFGKRGEKVVESLLKANGIDMSFEQFKRQRMYMVLLQNGIKINKTLKQSIDTYCHFLTTDKQDFSQIESVVATIRKIGGELDNSVYSADIRDEEMQKICDRIWMKVKHCGSQFDIVNFLPQADNYKPLTQAEAKYFEQITSLQVCHKQDNMDL